MTIKQTDVIKDLSENVGKPIGQAMRDAGYSVSTSKTPARLTQSKAWKDMVQEALPDELLLNTHVQGLDATKIVQLGDETMVLPDFAIRYRFLDMAYKIKGKYGAPVDVPDVTLPHWGLGLTEEQMDRILS